MVSVLSFDIGGSSIKSALIGVAAGRPEIIEDYDRIFEMGKSLVSRTAGVEYTDDMKPMVDVMINKRVCVKIDVDRYVSWDHRKLGLPEMPKPPS